MSMSLLYLIAYFYEFVVLISIIYIDILYKHIEYADNIYICMLYLSLSVADFVKTTRGWEFLPSL